MENDTVKVLNKMGIICSLLKLVFVKYPYGYL